MPHFFISSYGLWVFPIAIYSVEYLNPIKCSKIESDFRKIIESYDILIMSEKRDTPNAATY